MAAAALPFAMPATSKAAVVTAGALGVIGAAVVTKEALSQTQRPEKEISSESCPPEVLPEPIKESKPASFSPSLDESYDKTLEDVAKDISISRAMPEFSGLRPQAARDPPVRVSYGREGSWNIHVPFPFSIPVLAGYLLYHAFSSSDSESSAAPAASSATTESVATAMLPPDDEQDSEGDDNKFLERKDLEGIYEALKKKAAADFGSGSSRTIWKNRDFRIDAGHLRNGVRHWEFQVNSNPASQAAKQLLKRSRKQGTHAKHFKGAFDTNNPPEFKDWMRAFLDALTRL